MSAVTQADGPSAPGDLRHYRSSHCFRHDRRGGSDGAAEPGPQRVLQSPGVGVLG
jgi:hypothetical protein